MQSLLLKPAPTQTEVASRLGVTQQTVQRHFESAHGPLIGNVLEKAEAA